MKKISLSLLLCCLLLFVASQSLPKPALWLNAEESAFVGRDSAGILRHFPIYFGDILLLSSDKINGYSSLNIKGDSYFFLETDVLHNVQQSLFLIAFQSFKEPDVDYSDAGNLPEYGLWSLIKGDTTHLTTLHYGIGESKCRYQFNDYPGIIITSNMLSFKSARSSETEDSPTDTIIFCYSDSFYFRGKLAEFVIITDYVDENMRQVWQSYLAMKYGGTLFEGNYLNSAGDTLWYYEGNKDFSFGIGGIGRDDGLSLNQHFSTIAGDSLTISLHGCDIGVQNTVETDNYPSLQHGEYIFWGHNDRDFEISKSVVLLHNAEEYYLFDKIWKIRPFTYNSATLDFRLNMPVFEYGFQALPLQLFISTSPAFEPEKTRIVETDNYPSLQQYSVKFDSLIFADTVSYFTFGYAKEAFDNFDFSASNSDNVANSEQNPLYQVFTEAEWQPNPVVDDLKVSYKLTRNAVVWFTLTYSNGTPILHTPHQNLSEGNHQTPIPMSHLATGIYTVYIHVDGMIAAQVLIKL